MQINCTYYSAVGNHDDWYLLARAIQLFTPGIPLVYYVGLLAGANDISLVEETKNGRDINRHGFSLDEAISETERPVVKVRRRAPRRLTIVCIVYTRFPDPDLPRVRAALPCCLCHLHLLPGASPAKGTGQVRAQKGGQSHLHWHVVGTLQQRSSPSAHFRPLRRHGAQHAV